MWCCDFSLKPGEWRVESGDYAYIFPLKITKKKFNKERFWSFCDAQMQGFYLFYESVTICIKPTPDTKKYI